MATVLNSLSKLFTDRMYRIPDYQRGYSWGEKQIKDFWSDLVNLEDGNSHYAGVITLEEVPVATWKSWGEDSWLIKSKGFTPYYVVDGQQRLTTAVVLIQCFIESIGVADKLNYDTASEIRKRYIRESQESGVANSYIFGYEIDNPSHEYLKQVVFKETKNPRSLEETAYTKNLERAKNYFSEQIRNLSRELKENLFRRLTHSVLFNVYEIESEIDVFVAFETMNNRGKPLTHLELLKNRLIFLTTKLSTYSKHETSSLRSKINDCWRSIYHHLGKNPVSLLEDDRFLLTHSLLYFPDRILGNKSNGVTWFRIFHNAKWDLQTILLEEIFIQSHLCQKALSDDEKCKRKYPVDIVFINKYVTSLKANVELWFDIQNPNLSNFSADEKLWLDRVSRINGINTFGTAAIILALFQKKSDSAQRVSFLKVLENTIFLFNLYGGIGTDTFVRFAIDLVQGRITPDRLAKQIESFAPELRSQSTIVNAFKTISKRPNGFYDWPVVRYFLYEYEQHLRAKTKTERAKIVWDDLVDPPTDHCSIEHIYPQNSKDDCWTLPFKDFTPRQKSLLRHSLGNLLALSRPKNSSLQNKCFNLKKSEKDKFVGYAYGSFSENEVAQFEKWDAQTIVDRGILLLEFAEKRWGLDFGDKSKKVEMLSLEFVAKGSIPKVRKST